MKNANLTELFALSGASGTGKTVTLEAIRNKGYCINNISVSRDVLQRMQTTLDDVTGNYELMHIFQEGIKKEMDYRQDLLLTTNLSHTFEGQPAIFVDRSHGDLYGYAQHWESTHSKTGLFRWLRIYERDLVGHAKAVAMTFILPPGKFDHVDDGVRAKSNTQDPVHAAILDFYDRHGIDYHIVESISAEDRANEIIDIAKGYMLP